MARRRARDDAPRCPARDRRSRSSSPRPSSSPGRRRPCLTASSGVRSRARWRGRARFEPDRHRRSERFCGEVDAPALPASELRECLADELRRARRAPSRRRGARLQGERSSRFATKRWSRRASARTLSIWRRLSSPLSLTSGEAKALGRESDRGQRRSEVMADGAQDRGLDGVAEAQPLRLQRLPLESLTVDRNGQQRRQRRQEPIADCRARVRGCRKVIVPTTWSAARSSTAFSPAGPPRGGPSLMRALSTPSTFPAAVPIWSSSVNALSPCSRAIESSAKSASSRSRCSASPARCRARAADRSRPRR